MYGAHQLTTDLLEGPHEHEVEPESVGSRSPDHVIRIHDVASAF